MNEILDSLALTAFCCFNSPDEVPDYDTIGHFRNLLIRNALQQKIFDEVVKLITECELILKKGNTWHFGYKSHIGVDRESGLIHHVKMIAINEHDMTSVSDFMNGEKNMLHGDSGYIGTEKRPEAVTRNKKGKKIRYIICRKPSYIKKLSKSGQYAARKIEHKKSSVRCKVEHVFAVVKKLFGYLKNRYQVC